MNPNQIRRLFPHASASVLAANASDYGSGDATEPDSAPQTPPARIETPKQAHDSQKPHHDHLDRPRQTSAMERDSSDAPLATGQVQEGANGRILIRVTSIRRRLADEDGLCEKYMVDCCRYAGLVLDDAPGICKIETTQRKAAKGEAERTEIAITYP